MEIADHAGETNGPEPVEGNGGETRARKENPREEANEDEREGAARRAGKMRGRTGERWGRGGGGRERVVSRRQSPSTVAGVPTG